MSKGVNRTIIRWAVPLLIPLGYLLTEGLYEDRAGVYFILTVASYLSLLLLVTAIRRLSPTSVTAALILTVLIVGYYLEFYLMSYALLHGWSSIDLRSAFGYFVIGVTKPDLLLDAYMLITYSFSVFAVLSSIILRGCRKRSKWRVRIDPHRVSGIVYKIITISLVLFVITSVVRLYFDLGSKIQPVVLPMKIGGITTIINSQVVPFLMVTALGFSYHGGKRRTSIVAIIFLALGAIQFLLFYSKLHLVLPLISILLFRLIYGTYALKGKIVFVIFLMMISVYPFLNVYRGMAEQLRVSGLSTFSVAVDRGRRINQIDNLQSSMAMGAFALFSRVGGLKSLLIIMDARDEYARMSVVDNLLDNETITDVLGQKIIGVDEGTGIGEGLLGGFYYVTGSEYGTSMFVAIWTIVALSVVHRLWLVGTALSMNMVVIWMIFCLQTTSGGVRVMNFLWFGFAIAVVYLVVRVCQGKEVGSWSFNTRKTMTQQRTNVLRNQKGPW